MVGVDVYPLPLETISILFTRSPLRLATAVAVTPQSPLVDGSPIVTVGAMVYPVPPEPTDILVTVWYNLSKNTISQIDDY